MSDTKRAVTPVGILSYPHLFKPQAGFNEGDEPKYSAVIIFEEGTDLADLKAVAAAAAKEKWGDKVPKNLRSPFREDWEDRKGYPENSVYINAKSSSQPGIVSRYNDPKTGKVAVITDESELYPGCKVRLSISAFAYDRAGNRGVAFALNNVQKWDEGERLDGRASAADEFTGEDLPEADLGELGPQGSDDEVMAAFM